MNHYQVFGLSPKLLLDEEKLREDFYSLSKQVHPDRFSTRPAPEPAHALRWSTALNRAFQTLRDRETRSRYLLELLGGEARKACPPMPFDLAETYFELQETLGQGTEPLLSFKKKLEGEMQETESSWQNLAQRWETENESTRKAILTELGDLLVKRKYLNSMLADLNSKVEKRGDSRD